MKKMYGNDIPTNLFYFGEEKTSTPTF